MQQHLHLRPDGPCPPFLERLSKASFHSYQEYTRGLKYRVVLYKESVFYEIDIGKSSKYEQI